MWTIIHFAATFASRFLSFYKYDIEQTADVNYST